MPMVLLLLLLNTAPGATDADVAQQSPDPEKGVVRETMVVTATRSERAVSELPVSTTVITEAEIEAAPVLTVDDLLRTVPGVYMPYSTSTNTFFGASTVSMRGLGGSRALVLVDGIPIHEPLYGTVLWQKVPLDTVRQIEVVRGSNASLFGNFALGGTIHLLTRNIEQDEVRVDASYGTNATQRQSISVDRALGDRWGLRFGHHRFSTNGVLRIVTPGPVDVRAWNDTAVTTARGDVQLSEATRGSLKAAFTSTDLSAGTALSSSGVESFDLSAAIQHAVGRGGLLSATIFRKDEQLDIVNTTVLAGRTTEFQSSFSDIPVDDYGASVEWFGPSDGTFSLISFGVDLRQTDADERRRSVNRSGAITLQDSVGGHQKFGGLFGQASWRPNTRLEILASARIDYFSNRGENIVVGGATTKYPSTTTTQFDPRLAFRYELAGNKALRGAVYRAFKAPTLRDLYRNAQTPTSLALANPNLGPETLVGADLGIEWATPRVHAELNLYRNEIDQLLTRVRLADVPPTSQTQNVGTARSQGIEALADVKLSGPWSLQASYAFTDAKIVENAGDPTLEGKDIENVVPQIGTLGLRYLSARGTSLTARYRILSQAWGEAVNLGLVPAHRVLDVSASRPLRLGIDFYVIAENVLNEKYNYVISATNFRPAQTRTVSAGVRYHFPSRSND